MMLEDFIEQLIDYFDLHQDEEEAAGASSKVCG